MEFSFNTIKSPVENILLKEKGSKFIGFVFPLDDEKDLKKNLEKIREEHPKATHHCYAFRLGIKGENYRANDDGEPSGSAGLPIYNQLLAHDITNVLLIEVRYYGGTKLGVSGLVKAYKESAKVTLEEAEKISIDQKDISYVALSLKLNIPIWSNDKDLKKQNKIKIISEEKINPSPIPPAALRVTDPVCILSEISESFSIISIA